MKYIKAILTILILLAPAILWAQGGPGGSSSFGDPGVPIDGGASILAAGAVAYGIKKLKKKRQDVK